MDTKPLSLIPLVFLIFFEVSGGPFGTEVCTVAAQTIIQAYL